MENSNFNAHTIPPRFGLVGEHGTSSQNKFGNIEDILVDCFDEGFSNQSYLGHSGYSGSLESLDFFSPNSRHDSPALLDNNRSVVPHLGGSGDAAGLMDESLYSRAMIDDVVTDDVRPKRQKNVGVKSISEQQKMERRVRNREHAKRSRVRKKFLLESLQKSVSALQGENERLRTAIKNNCNDATDLLEKAQKGSGVLALSPEDATRVLDDPDYSLVRALQTAQQNFVITDPMLPDNPIVFASQGFLDLTGYSMGQVLGRNCRFLQGPDTDPKAVEQIRNAISSGYDTSVCLLNYRADGSTFWNQFFIAALRDADEKIINYVGVQCRVTEEFVAAIQKQEEEEQAEDSRNEDEGDQANA